MAKSIAPRRRGPKRIGDESDDGFPSGPSLEELIGVIRDILPTEAPGTSSVGADLRPLEMARSADVALRAVAAGLRSLDRETLTRLAEDQEETVRVAVGGNLATPPLVLARLALDQSDAVRLAVAGNPVTPPSVLSRLNTDAAINVRRASVENPSSPHDPTGGAIPTEAQGWGAGAYGQGPWSGIFPQSDEDRLRGALDPAASADALRTYARTDEKTVRTAVAKHPSTPMDVMLAFTRDSSVGVRRALASNPAAPSAVLDTLLNDRPVRVQAAVAANGKAPTEVLMRLAISKVLKVRRAVAANPATPAELLIHLSADSDRGVREAVAGNPTAPNETKWILANDVAAEVRESVRIDPSRTSLVIEPESTEQDAVARSDGRAHKLSVEPLSGTAQIFVRTTQLAATLQPAKPAKVKASVRRHSRDIAARADAALIAIDAYLADIAGHNLGPPLDDIEAVPGSLEAVRWTLLAFRSSLTAPDSASDPDPIIATGEALWNSICGLVSGFSQEAAKSAGYEFGKWGGRALALAVGWMVLDMLAKAGFAPSSQPLDAIQKMLRSMIGTGPS